MNTLLKNISSIFLISFLGIAGCTTSNNQSIEEEIENYLEEFYPGYELFPDDFPKPNLFNKVNPFEGSIIHLEKTSQTHLQVYDFNSDGYDDYYLEIYSLKYDPPPNSDHFNYYTSTVIIFGSEVGLNENSLEMENLEYSTSGTHYHLLDRKAFIINKGTYFLSNNVVDTLIIEQNSLAVYEDEIIGIRQWLERGVREHLLINR